MGRITVDNITLPVELWQIEEVLEKRIYKFGCKIDDLFMVMSSASCKPDPGFHDTVLETKHGKLKLFFSPYCPKGCSYVLHRAKFDYPRKGSFHTFDKHGDLVN